MITSIMLLALLGLCVSVYTYLTEMKIKQDPTYKPVCDLSDRISCSKTIQSPYGKMLFVSNAIVGIAFYAGMTIASFMNAHMIILLGSISSFIVSCFLAYVLYEKVRVLCLLCMALYIINTLMLIYSFRMICFCN